MNRIIAKTGLAFTTALNLSMATAAFAQTNQATSPDAADIIVTARRVEERLQDVPISISVFNQQQLTNRNVVNSTDLATYTPSLSANANFGQENATFAIRGFVQDAGTAPSVGVYFADVVALRGPTQGTQAGDGAGPGNFFDLANVQVLKGPQGTLQGRNTTGGAVLFVPQKPTSKTEGYVEGSYGNYDMHRVQAMFNTPLGENARFRVAMDHQDRDGWLHNISGIGPKDFNNINYTAARASLVVDLTPDLENYTIASYSRSDTNGSVQKLIGCDPAQSIGNFLGLLSCGQLAREKAQGAGFYDIEQAFPNPTSQITQWQVINTTTWKASDTLTVKNIASYGQFTDVQRTALFGTNFKSSDLPNAQVPGIPFPVTFQQLFGAGVPPIFTDINATRYTADQYTFTEELQLQGSALNDKFTYQGGFYFESSKPLGTCGGLSNQTLACSNIDAMQCTDLYGEAFGQSIGALNLTSGRVSYRDVGLYAQTNYNITDKLKLTTGFRYTWDKQTASATRYFYSFPAPNTPSPRICTNPLQAPSCSEFLEQKSNKPTWLIDLDYKPTDDILAYGKWARGYRSGGVFANGPDGFQTFQPEKVDSFEGGLKTTFRGAVHGTFNVSGFYNNFSNQQIQLGFNANPNYNNTGLPAPVSPTTAIENVGKSRIYGVEVEATLTPFKGFTLDGAYTYLNATIRKISSFDNNPPPTSLYIPSNANIAPGSPLALSPKNKVSITGTYTLPLDPSIGRISVGATFTHTDKMLTNYVYPTAAAAALYGADLSYVQATNLLNLNVSWNSVAGWPIDLSAFASNVTNVHYYTYIPGLGGLVDSPTGPQTGAGDEFGVVGEPRMYGVRLRYRFGS